MQSSASIEILRPAGNAPTGFDPTVSWLLRCLELWPSSAGHRRFLPVGGLESREELGPSDETLKGEPVKHRDGLVIVGGAGQAVRVGDNFRT